MTPADPYIFLYITLAFYLIGAIVYALIIFMVFAIVGWPIKHFAKRMIQLVRRT